MTGKLTASWGALCAALLGVAAISAATPATAGLADKLRESFFRHGASDAAGPPLGHFVTEDGRAFTLDRTQPMTLLKFDDSPEVFVLDPSPAPRGDVIYKDDMGEPILRATRLGGFTLFTDDRPNGEAVSLAGGSSPLRLLPLSPQALGERMLQASFRAGRAARHTVVFQAEATPASASLIGDSAVVTAMAIIRIAQDDDGERMLARLRKVFFEEGKKASASLNNGVLRVVIAPDDGLAGRPSSHRIEKAIRR